MNHLLLTDIEGKKVIVNVDFMMAVSVQYKKPQTNDKVAALKDRLIDATNVIYGSESGILVLETPEVIYEMMVELDYEYVADGEQESDEKDEDPDEAGGMRALPPSSPRLEGCDMQAVQRLPD
jgi:hypothetical protein